MGDSSSAGNQSYDLRQIRVILHRPELRGILMQEKLPLTGRCACGEIQFECRSLPLVMFKCHCRDCQRATGSAYAPNVWFNVTDVSISSETRSYDVVSDAGNSVKHDFCGDCGSPIGMRTDHYPELRGFRAATFDDMTLLQPAANIFMKNSPPWEHRSDLDHLDGQPTDEYIASLLQP
jgi:hypothetical protein